ncbi:hypothetical protein J5N97_024908 [Dioscorea zingiberensis]|uniref:Uncharacterized protein n=1 Tax=Dioscorea zingiberensis TaxID=325984 RepID=A0A9D5C7B6_9LILI|nr:hypothetical protein J5N97_024908 [Dioscorea zingiberensis]
MVGENSPEYDNIFDKKLLTDLEARFQLDCWYQNENDFHQACNLQDAEREFRALFCNHSTLSRLQYLDQGVGTHCVLMEDREQLPCNLDSDRQIPCLENGHFVTSEFNKLPLNTKEDKGFARSMQLKSCRNLSGHKDYGYDSNLEIAEKEYKEAFGCSHQAQMVRWNRGDTDDDKFKGSVMPQQSPSDATFNMLETRQKCNNFHKLSNTEFENVPLEGVRKQNGNLNASTVLASENSLNRNTSADNYVGLMTGKSDSIVLSCRPDLDMQSGNLKLREIKHKFGENITDVVVHAEISSPSSLSAHTSKTINIPSADNDVYSCDAEESSFILEKQPIAVSEAETTCFPFRCMDIPGGSIDLFASPGRIKPPAECHMDTIADVFTLETDKPHSCLNVDTVESNGHILSSENKKEILLEVCKYAPAPSGSHSSDATPCVNSACIMNESNMSVIHKVQCTIGGGLIEDANKRVAPRIRIVDKERNSAHAGRDGAGQFPLNIRLASLDSRDKPLVRFKYFSSLDDLEACVSGTRKVGEVLAGRSMDEFRVPLVGSVTGLRRGTLGSLAQSFPRTWRTMRRSRSSVDALWQRYGTTTGVASLGRL